MSRPRYRLIFQEGSSETSEGQRTGWSKNGIEWNFWLWVIGLNGAAGETKDKGQQMIQSWRKVLEDRVLESRKNRTKWTMCAPFKFGKWNHKIAWLLGHCCKVLYNVILLVSLNLEWMMTFWQQCLSHKHLLSLRLCTRQNVRWYEITN